ncbi:ATP-binding protein [Roseateles sp. BYS180W]|uniref:ATP-binding protein n=1 Tax=Roseateles rivi TaxID=3299028 RepID=A0ABW7FW36_9BURK
MKESTLMALLERAEGVLCRLEGLLPAPPQPPDWNAAVAFRWRRRGAVARLEPVTRVAAMALEALREVDAQKERLLRNTQQFVQGQPANNVLLTGARGTGKSSLVRACLGAFASQGLRLIEVDKSDLVDLPDIAALTAGRPERFVVFCDDLSFEEGESGYKALKSMLDGSIAATEGNVLIYATSNRRHLLPERMQDNLGSTRGSYGEIHPGEAVEEKISLSERFGMWISFYPFSQDEYLAIVSQWLRHHGVDEAAIQAAQSDALVWALERGSRSGRVASQFARDLAGRLALGAAALQPQAANKETEVPQELDDA